MHGSDLSAIAGQAQRRQELEPESFVTQPDLSTRLRAMADRLAPHGIYGTDSNLCRTGADEIDLWRAEWEQISETAKQLRLALTAEAQRYRDGLDAWRANNVTHAVRIKVLEAKLLELAGECAECAGSGTRMTTSGVIESEPCPDCDDIRELLK